MTDSTGASTYQYDAGGRLVQVAKPNGTISYSYDSANNLTSSIVGSTQVSYTFDALNRLASVSETNSGATNYVYDAVGNVATVTYPNGVTSTYSYNTKNELTSLGIGKGSSNIAGYTYSLDAVGHRLRVNELTGRTVNYAYDQTYRLTSEGIAGDPAGPNSSVNYTYDAVGNRTQMTSTLAAVPSGAFTYDADDRLSRDTYDSDGNTTSSNGIANTYDFENHLIQRGGVTMIYDGDGNRVKKIAGGVTTKYLVDDHSVTGLPQVSAEASSDGSSRTFIYGLERISQRQVISNSANAVTSFYIYDGHGSVRALTDPSGATTDTYDYDAFGNLINSTGSTPNEFLFAGEQFDSDLGLYYNRARYFDPTSGRFWSMDGTDGNAEPPKSLHRYLYARGDPVNRIDPSGNQDLGDTLASVAIQSILSDIATSVLTSPLGQSAGGIVASALLPPGFFDTIVEDAQTPEASDPMIFGVAVSAGFPIKGPVGISFEGGFEALVSPTNGNFAVYSAFSAGLTFGHARAEVGANWYGGFVWHAPTSDEYGKLAPIISIKVASVPQKVTTTLSNDWATVASDFLRRFPSFSSAVGWAGVMAAIAPSVVSTSKTFFTGTAHFNFFWEDFPKGARGFTISGGTFEESAARIGFTVAEQIWPHDDMIVHF
jgi:RHS repeat-associated protein